MAQQNATGEAERVKAHTVTEGDRVAMKISPHGMDVAPTRVVGTIVDAPSEELREMMADGDRIMADYAIDVDREATEACTPIFDPHIGERYRWNVDNGYVLGYHPGLERRSDVGRFNGFETVE